jgi:hypothetical protein
MSGVRRFLGKKSDKRVLDFQESNRSPTSKEVSRNPTTRRATSKEVVPINPINIGQRIAIISRLSPTNIEDRRNESCPSNSQPS